MMKKYSNSFDTSKILVSKLLNLGYNIDIHQGEIGQYSNSSHEFGIVFYLNNSRQVFNWGSDLNIEYK